MSLTDRYKTAWRADRLFSRFASKFSISDSGCWVWLAARDRDGYGVFRFPWGNGMAHRVSYELLVGDIPDGLHVDHLCRNRACVNPAHLEPVSCRENLMRSPVTAAAKGVAQRTCRRGHEFSLVSGRRVCRVCSGEAQKRYKERKASA